MGVAKIAKLNMRLEHGGDTSPSWQFIYSSEPMVANTFATVRVTISGNKLFTNIGASQYSDAENPPAQNVDSSSGKTLMIDLRTNEVKQVSKGHRAVLGLTVDDTGQLWATDNAERGGDKLERIEAGQNYGWPFSTIGTRYFTYQRENRQKIKTTAPVYSWIPSIAPSALIFVKDFSEEWNGDLLVASLKAQSLYRIRLNGDKVLFVEPIWLGHRIRDIVSRPGSIFLSTDDGSLIELKIARKLYAAKQLNENGGSQPALAQCLNCHSFSRQDATSFGPSLHKVLGRRIGGDVYAYYSDALRENKAVWNEDLLAAYLKSPGDFAQGTTMPNLGLGDAAVAQIIKGLKALDETDKASVATRPLSAN